MSCFFNDPAPPAIYTLSLHDALPISADRKRTVGPDRGTALLTQQPHSGDRKSTRLNSSHVRISYAVFCLKKKINAYLLPDLSHTALLIIASLHPHPIRDCHAVTTTPH